MADWLDFILALTAFLGSHILPRLGGLRERLIASLGRRVYFSLYGVLSLILLAWVILAAGAAPQLQVWPHHVWMRWLLNLVMPVVFILVFCGIGLPAPNTLGSKRGTAFDPSDPGFASVSRHPLLLALLLWASAHLLANGELAHVILFGVFAGFPVVAMWAFDRKSKRQMGQKAEAFFDQTAWLSLKPLLQPHWWQQNLRGLALRAGLGLFTWIVVLHLHEPVIGAWPFP
jgi:uncharacterized membrane protein